MGDGGDRGNFKASSGGTAWTAWLLGKKYQVYEDFFEEWEGLRDGLLQLAIDDLEAGENWQLPIADLADDFRKYGALPNNFELTLPDAKQAARAVRAFKDEHLLDYLDCNNIVCEYIKTSCDSHKRSIIA